MRFIHAADVHLDSPLRGLDAYEGAPVDAIRGATRHALRNLVQLAIAERVAFVVLAGDLYDGDWPDYNTGLFFVNRMRELAAAAIPVVLLSGNHDAASRITARLTHPPNVHVLPTDRPATVTLNALRVALHGQGYAQPAETRNLVADYPPPSPGFFNVGILHTALEGRDGHASYAPCSLAELLARGYNYWALGHVHQRESVNGPNRVRVEYPGNLQGRHARECGAKGCLLVTVAGGGSAVPEFCPLDVFRWDSVSVDATALAFPAEVLEAAALAIADARHQADGRPLAARVQVSCHEHLYRQLAAEHQRLHLDLASQVGGDIWIEKLKLVSASPTPCPDAAVSEDAAAELRAVLGDLRSDTAAAQAAFALGDCGKLTNLLPTELRGVLQDHWDEVFDRAAAFLGGDHSEQVP